MRHSNRSPLIVIGLAALLGLAAPIGFACRATPAFAQSRIVSSSTRPQLDSEIDVQAVQTFRARGRDPLSPRDIALWSWEGTRWRRIGLTRSATGGDFDFGEQPIPIGRGEFQVAVAGERPDRSRGIEIERPVPGPIVIATDHEPLEFTLIPSLFEGALRIHDARSGRLLFHRVIDRSSPRGQWIDLAAEGITAQSDFISIEQVLDDGRRSRATLWRAPRRP